MGKTVKNLKWINNGIKSKRVSENQLDDYLKDGWVTGQLPTTLSHVWVNKDGKNTTIDKSRLEEYLANGWIRGKVSSYKEKNRIRVSKDGITKSIQKEELDTYLNDGWIRGVAYASNFRWINNLKIERWTDEPIAAGWYLGRLIKDPYEIVSMYNDTEVIQVQKYLVGTYIELGYKTGCGKKVGLYEGSTKDTIWVNNGENTILIHKSELEEYLKLGYVRGSLNLKNKILVNKDQTAKFVRLSDLDEYLSNGYSIGHYAKNHMINKKWIQKDSLFKAVPVIEVQSYLDSGWTFGRPIKAAIDKIWVHKNNELTYIDLQDLQSYLDKGWHSGKTDAKFYINNGKEDRLVNWDDYNLKYRNLDEWKFGTKNHGPTSTVENQFIDILQENNIEYQAHFYLNDDGKHYYYDFKIDNILVELNPSATHNSTWSPYNNPKDTNYHYLKSQAASRYGYRCICIWDWDSVDILVNLLKPRKKIYARNCDIKEISVNDAKQFLNTYHFQGYAKDSIRIGMFYKDELVSIMTFGKPRYNKKYEYELIRYCSNSNVIGGAEKLFSYFTNTYNPKTIISYCDLSKFTGELYTKLGFTYKNTSIGKHWYHIGSKIHITDNLLRQQGFDRLVGEEFGVYGKGTNNEELMLTNGFVEIYDCGQSSYIMNLS